MKKLFFGALRIRKEQDAADKTLAQTRPATSFIVWEAIKNRMDEALERERKYVVSFPPIPYLSLLYHCPAALTRPKTLPTSVPTRSCRR